MGQQKKGGDTYQHHAELFPHRRTILRRPNSGICQFCLKIISSSNWSRHLRLQHTKEIIRMRRGGRTEEAAECPSDEEQLPSEPSQHSEGMGQGQGEQAQRMVVKEEESNNGAEEEAGEEEEEEDAGTSIGSTTEKRAEGANSGMEEEGGGGRRMGGRGPKRRKGTRILCAIKLPKDNVCPLCGKTTSPGNWSRHLKRHHPEFARAEPGGMVGITADQNQQLQHPNLMLNSLNGHNFAETDFSMVHLEQFLAQQKQHNDAFGTFGMGEEQPMEPMVVENGGGRGGEMEQQQKQPQQQKNNNFPMAMAAMEVKMERQNTAEEYLQRREEESSMGRMKKMMMRGMEEDGEEGRGRATTNGGREGPAEEASTSTAAAGRDQASSNRQKAQRRVSTIRPDKDGRCPLCGKSISSPNWRRHLLRCHPEEEQLAQYKYPDPSFPVPVPTRLFALYAATVQLPSWHLDNEFFRKFLCSIPDFDIPSHRLLHAQMDGEVERLKQCMRSELSSHRHLVAVSVHIEGGMVEGQMQQNWMAICAHLWSQSGHGTECVGLSLAPIGYSNEDIVDGVRDRLAEMELALDRNKLIHVTVDKCSVFSQSTKPAFFDPFPFIGGGLRSVLAMLAFPLEWHLVDSSPELLDAFFNGNSAEEELGNVFEEEGGVQFDEDAGFGVGRCASRRLETVLRTVFERDPYMVQLRKRIFCLLGQLVFSHSACSLLHSRSGGLLPLFPANSLWASLEHVYARLLNLSSLLGPICAEFKFPAIEDSDWKVIEEVLEVADTFHKFEAKLEQDSQPTISLLYPGLNLLLSTLQNFNQIPSVANSLIDLIQRSISDVLSPGHNSLFLCASMLDPKVAYLLVQECKQEGIAAVRQLVTRTVSDPIVFVRTRSGTESVDIVESPFGFGTVRRARMPIGTGKEQAGEERDQIDQEIEEYLAIVQLDSSDTCAHFWAKHEQKFPLLSQTAKSVLAIPATSATARYFLGLVRPQQSDPTTSTTGGHLDSGVRRALLTFNRRFIDLLE